jgi:predicted NBD/HSP70 family sugar kinase
MYFACDIGGTQMRIAGSKDCVHFDKPIIEETPDRPEEGLLLIIDTIKRLAGSQNIDAVSIGIAGVLNQEHSFLLKAPHLGKWERLPIKEKIEKALKTKVHIENDTDIVGLGEAMSGAGRGYEICVYITVSTGIGGVKIINGKFEKNRYGFEPGFQILNNETGQNWEDLSSGTAVEKKFGMHPKDVAKTSDWDEVENNVAIGLHNCILHWSPDVIVLGGAMSRDFDFSRLKDKISARMQIHPDLPDIKKAELDSIGGIYGGFAFLRQYYSL